MLLGKRPVGADKRTARAADGETHGLARCERRSVERGQSSAPLGQSPRPADGHEGRVRGHVTQTIEVPPFLPETAPVHERGSPSGRHLSSDEALVRIRDRLDARRQAWHSIAPTPGTGIDPLGDRHSRSVERGDHFHGDGDVSHPSDDVEGLTRRHGEAMATRLADHLVPVDAGARSRLHQRGDVGGPSQAGVRLGSGGMRHRMHHGVLARRRAALDPPQPRWRRREPEVPIGFGMEPVGNHVPVQIDQGMRRIVSSERMQKSHAGPELLPVEGRAVRQEPDLRPDRERLVHIGDRDRDVDVVHRSESHVTAGVMHDRCALQQHCRDARLAQRTEQRLAVGDEELRFQPGESGHLAELRQNRIIRVGPQPLEIRHQPRDEPLRGQVEIANVKTLFPCPEGVEGTTVSTERSTQEQPLARSEGEVPVLSATRHPGCFV